MKAHDQSIDLRQAINIVEPFLDTDLDLLDRVVALNDERVPDSTVHSLLVALEADTRTLALEWSDRPAVLDVWAQIGDTHERCAVAVNSSADPETLSRLARDETELVRRCLAYNPDLCLEATATLLADPSPLVQHALAETFEIRRKSQDEVDEDGPGGEDGLKFIYEMVPAAEEEDCLEDWRLTQHRTEPEFLGQPALNTRADPLDEKAAQDSAPTYEGPPLTPGQVLGLLQHRLGARELP